MESKKYSYIFTKSAEADIEGIIEYMAEELTNPIAAGKFIDELEAKLDDTCKSPGIGRLVENEYLKRDDVRRFLVGNYIAYYIADKNNHTIVLLRIVYGKRDQKQILRDI